MNSKIHNFPIISVGNLKAYIRAANSWPMLSSKEELELAKIWFYNCDLNAAKKLILSHLRFVIHISRNYSGYGLLQADLIQEGNIGLMKAVRRFDPSIGVRLVSFAVHWIKSEIHEYVLRNWRIVKVATTKSQRKLFFNLRKIKKRLGWFNEKELNMVAQELGVTSDDVREMESRMTAQDVVFNLFPYSDERSNDKFRASGTYLTDKTSNFAAGVEENNWEVYSANKLNRALLKLDERSRNIINSRWLNNEKRITLQKIASKYGISAERVRQLEKNAMKKLKTDIET